MNVNNPGAHAPGDFAHEEPGVIAPPHTPRGTKNGNPIGGGEAQESLGHRVFSQGGSATVVREADGQPFEVLLSGKNSREKHVKKSTCQFWTNSSDRP